MGRWAHGAVHGGPSLRDPRLDFSLTSGGDGPAGREAPSSRDGPLIPSETQGRASSPCDPGVGAHIVFVVVDPRQRITVSRNELTVACRLWGSRPIE